MSVPAWTRQSQPLQGQIVSSSTEEEEKEEEEENTTVSEIPVRIVMTDLDHTVMSYSC